MYTIRTLNNIHKKGIESLTTAGITLAEEDQDYDALILRSHSLHDYPLPDSLRAIARAGAGVNNIPIDLCSQKGIVVFNTPGANANSVKELVLALIIMSSRNLFESMLWTQSLAGRADEIPALIEEQKKNFRGPEIKQKNLGVIGLGAVGSLVANSAVSLGMKVLGYDPYISIETAWNLSHKVTRETSLEALVRHSDYITLHIPYTEQTKHYINAKTLAPAKQNLVLLNFSRENIVDTDAILEALQQKKLARYVTDFPEDSLLGTPGILSTPHLGASTPEAEENAAVMASKTLIDYLYKGTIQNSVNFPNAMIDSTSQHRLAIGNQNIPSMVSTITSLIARYTINIENMINQHKQDIAYTLIDIDQPIPYKLIQELTAQEGILFARYLKTTPPQ